MPNEIQQQIDVLKAKSKLTGADRARLKVLERELKQASKEGHPESKAKTNVFATTPTTKINPLPIRFSGGERAGLTQRANKIKTESLERVIQELGSEREINDTKLVRAAVYLLGQHSDEEIIEAIKQVKLNMIR